MQYRRTTLMLFRCIAVFEKVMRRFSRCGDQPFFNTDLFTWICPLEKQWPVIRAELDCVLQKNEHIPNFQDISPNQAYVASGNSWKTYFFYAYGHRVDKNCKSCPETVKLLDTIPGMKTAFFSILAPGSQIPMHRGPYKGVLRYHLGLKIPQLAYLCGITVGGITTYWEEGKSLVFDDMYPHKAWNLSDETRVVLFVDFLRPLPYFLDLMNRLIVRLIGRSHFVQEGVERFKKTETN
jgi:aspartyl/asparaginyl beta-hydroxylase (cupin superfamily)